jgi:hypothetical protein
MKTYLCIQVHTFFITESVTIRIRERETYSEQKSVENCSCTSVGEPPTSIERGEENKLCVNEAVFVLKMTITIVQIPRNVNKKSENLAAIQAQNYRMKVTFCS